MSSELLANSAEKWWSYETPRDIVKRAQIVAEEGEQSRRVLDIDTYASYINEDMPDTYILATRFREEPYRALRDASYSTKVYIPNEHGEYKHHADIVMSKRFLGHKVLFIDGLAVVINTEESIGVSAAEYIKMESLEAQNGTYTNTPVWINSFKREVVAKLKNLKKGENVIDAYDAMTPSLFI